MKNNFLKSSISILICTILVIAIFPAAKQIEGKSKKNFRKKEISEIEVKRTLDDLKVSEKNTIKSAVKLSENDGRSAAILVNSFKEDDEVFEIATKEVLDNYYGKNDSKINFEEFSESLDGKADEILVDYKEAYEERSNEGNVDYNTSNILVTLEEGVDDSTIEVLTSNLAASYEVIIDDDFVIDGDLNARKRNRLENFKKNHKWNKVIRVDLNLDQTTDKAIEQFSMYECVNTVEKNLKDQTETVSTNDTYLSKQWYLDRIWVDDAWKTQSTAGCSDIWVAVIDTGLDLQHEDLQGKYLSNRSVDVTKKDASGNYKLLTDLSKTYDSNHGTLVSGTIAAKKNNGKGICGIATGYDGNACRIMAVKASTLNEKGEAFFYCDDVAKGIIHAVNKGAEVINLSMSGGASDTEKKAIEYAEEAGVVVVAAAGNSSSNTKSYPAAFSSVISVAATSKSDKRASYSNYGSWIDIAAPGDSIYTTTIKNEYCEASGTSLAAPLVSATVALMLSVNPDLTPNKIRTFLYNNAGYIDSSSGNGLVDAEYAVQEAKYQEFKNSTIKLKSVTSPSSGALKINWNNLNVYGPEKIRIYRSTSQTGTFTLVKTVTDGNSTSYTETGLTKGKTYYYKIRASMAYCGGEKYTPYSDIVSCKVN